MSERLRTAALVLAFGCSCLSLVITFLGLSQFDLPIVRYVRSVTVHGPGNQLAIPWMAFTSMSTNFGATSSGTNVFLRNLATGEIRAITDATFGAAPPAMSRDAAYVVFGAASKLDSRFNDTGLFAYFTAAQRAWWWID